MTWKRKDKNRPAAENGERGAIIVEATISLTVFMFAMFTLLSVIQMAYAQSRISVALTCATKEIAEYAHVYFATGLNDTFSGTGGKSSEVFGEVGSFLETIGGDLGSLDSELGQFVTESGGAMSSTSIATLGKDLLGETLVRQMMNGNLGDGTEGSEEAFMRKYHIDGIDLLESSFLAGNGNNIYFRVKYRINVVQLLDINYGFDMSTWAYADAWSGK